MSVSRSHLVRPLAVLAAGLFSATMATGLQTMPAAAVDAPRLDTASMAPLTTPALDAATQEAGIIEIRAGGGRGGGGGGFRGGGGGFRGGHGGYRGGGGRGLGYGIGIPLVGYGAYYGYNNYYNDCRTVRVREHSCYRDSDGDRHCGPHWVYRRVCD